MIYCFKKMCRTTKCSPGEHIVQTFLTAFTHGNIWYPSKLIAFHQGTRQSLFSGKALLASAEEVKYPA